MSDVDMEQAEAVISRLANIASAFSKQAGVGACETAGHLISYLADHPRDIEPLLKFGVMELPGDWLEKGSLTYHGRDGKVWRPVDARRARIIRALGGGLA